MTTTTMTPVTLTISDADQAQFQRLVPILLDDLRPPALGDADGPYLEVVPQWWGLVFVLSPQATNDLLSGLAGASALSALLAAACMANPAAAAVAGIVSAILALHMVLIGAMNRGNGIYLTALWPLLGAPPSWVPTPR